MTSVIIVSVLMIAAMSTIGAVARSRRLQADRQRAFSLGQQLMAEVLQGYFAAPGNASHWGPETGETSRSLYDDVDDYDGYAETNPTTKAGVALSGYTGWKRAVKVESVSPLDPTTTLSNSTLRRVTVTVTSPAGRVVTLVGLRSQYGIYEQSPTSTTNYLPYVGVELQVGSNGVPVEMGARPLNVSTSQ